jgi:hypothetical protein
MRRSCPPGILVTQKKSPSGALRWRGTALRTKFDVRFAKVSSPHGGRAGDGPELPVVAGDPAMAHIEEGLPAGSGKERPVARNLNIAQQVMKGGGDLDRAAVDLGGKASRRPGPGLHQLGRPRRSPPPGRAVRPPPACALSAQGCSR